VADAIAALKGNCLSTMRPKDEGVEASLLSPNIQRCHVGKEMVDPIGVDWGFLGSPLRGYRIFLDKSTFRLTLIVNAVESDNTLEEDVEFWMTRWILGHFKQGPENVDQDLFETFDFFLGLVDVIKSRDLYEPSNVM
jgi:hypothetical protein